MNFMVFVLAVFGVVTVPYEILVVFLFVIWLLYLVKFMQFLRFVVW